MSTNETHYMLFCTPSAQAYYGGIFSLLGRWDQIKIGIGANF